MARFAATVVTSISSVRRPVTIDAGNPFVMGVTVGNRSTSTGIAGTVTTRMESPLAARQGMQERRLNRRKEERWRMNVRKDDGL